MSPLFSDTSGCSEGCCSRIEISISITDFQSRATLVAATEADRYKLYFYLNPEVLSCKKTMFLGAFDAGTVLAQSLRSFFQIFVRFLLLFVSCELQALLVKQAVQLSVIITYCICFRLSTHQPGARKCAAFISLPPSSTMHGAPGICSASWCCQLSWRFSC